MKKKSVLAVMSLLALSIGLGACTNPSTSSSISQPASSLVSSNSVVTPSSSSSSSSSSVYVAPDIKTLTITNAEELKAEWHVDEADRQVKLSADVAINPTDLVRRGLLKITSSDSKVVVVNGTYLHAAGEGNATVTVAYGTVTATVDLTVQASLKEPDYVTDATWEQITADGVDSSKAYVATVKVSALGSKKEGKAGQYGNLYVTDQEGKNEIQVYGSSATASALSYNKAKKAYSFTNPKNFDTNDDTKGIKVGDVLTVVLIRADYKTTKEISAVITSVNGTSVSNGILNTDEIQKVANQKFYSYTVKGKITKWKSGSDGSDYGNFYIKSDDATGSEVLVYGATASASALKIENNQYKFENPKDWKTNAATKNLAVGDEVTLHAIRADYKDTIEIVGVIEANVEPAAEPAAVETTIAELNKLTANVTDKLYIVSGIWENGKKDDYGNACLTDPSTGDSIVVFGASTDAEKTGITFDGSSGSPVYTYSNPKVGAKDVADGELVTMKVLYKNYNGTGEIVGAVTSHVTATTVYTASVEETENGTITLSKSEGLSYGEEVTVTATPASGYTLRSLKVTDATGKETDITKSLKFTAKVVNKVKATFVSSSLTYKKVASYNLAGTKTDLGTADNLKARFASGASTEEGLSDIVTAVSDPTNVSLGYIYNEGKDNEQNYTSLGLKFGTSKKNGSMTVKTSTDVSRAVVVVAGWTATDKVSVGGADAQTPGVKYTESDALKTLTFDFTATSSVKIEFEKRGYLQSIEFYTAE